MVVALVQLEEGDGSNISEYGDGGEVTATHSLPLERWKEKPRQAQ